MQDILKKYSKPVPRYTSYPTAPHFHDGVTDKDYQVWLKEIDAEKNVSLYIHIPFCQQLCWYCGCNTKVTNKYSALESYVDALLDEMSHVSKCIGKKLNVSHIHWGGGTPTMLSPKDFQRISDKVFKQYNVLDTAEIAVEIDPRTLTQEMAKTLSRCKVNRASLGVQDFNADVQKAINRIQPYEMTKRAVEWLKAEGINSINFDLIYGLPLQTKKTIHETILKTNELKPERVALFGYAHVPWMKKHQKLLEKHHLPNTEERAEMAEYAENMLVDSGYVDIGLDHFSLPEDSLAMAYKQGKLNRNFQGYTVDEADTLIAFGASSIGKLPNGFIQNKTSVRDYIQAIEEFGFATEKGFALSEEDNTRSSMISKLMCQSKLSLSDFEDVKGWEDEKIILHELARDGVIEFDGSKIEMTTAGQPLVRVVAAVFDQYLSSGKAKHSKAI